MSPHAPPSLASDARIYVAGHRGLVGSALIRRLKERGFRNIVTATREKLDLRDQAAVNNWFRANQPEYIFLVAGTVGGILANSTRPAEFIYDNLMIHSTVVHAAYLVGVRRLLYLGSSCIYPRECPQPIREEYLLTSQLDPTNEPYAVAKIAGIKLCQAYRRQYGCDFISAMPTNLYGPNDNFDLETSHVVPALIRKFHEAKTNGSRQVTIWGTGSPRREFLHVDDLADACLFLMERYDGEQHINIGTGEDLTILELAHLIRDVVAPGTELEFDTEKPDGTLRKLLDISQLRGLGWAPSIALREGIEGTYHWFEQHHGEEPEAAVRSIGSRTDRQVAPMTSLAPAPAASSRRRPGNYSRRKQAFREHSDQHAATRDRRITRNAFYYESEYRHLRTLIPEGSSVLDLGCGTGDILEKLRPKRGVGIDISPEMVAIARAKLPDMELHVGDVEDESDLACVEGPFDYIVLSDTLAALDDCEVTLSCLHRLCRRETRIVISHYSSLWEPVLRIAEWLGVKTRQPELNWLSAADIVALLELAGFEAISVNWRQLCPKRLLGIGSLVNRYLANLPLIRQLCLRHYVIARSLVHRHMPPPSVTVVIPCRNERDNVEQAVLRMPQMCRDQELLFVEGHSEDGTWEEIQRVCKKYGDRNVRALQQSGVGKADAVWAGFAAAKGELLMILDGDLTVPPESLPKFYRAVCEGYGEFVMGSRMVYPVEAAAMRFLNYWANRVFAVLFTWLLRQRITDTLCGTKVITRVSYERLAREETLGQRDPFGDFDLILGAARQNLKIVEIPIRYVARSYGETQISRFRQGLMLAKMVATTYRRMLDS